jgi:hypothetical protein
MPILQQYESIVHAHKKQKKSFIKQYTYWTFPNKNKKVMEQSLPRKMKKAQKHPKLINVIYI